MWCVPFFGTMLSIGLVKLDLSRVTELWIFPAGAWIWMTLNEPSRVLEIRILDFGAQKFAQETESYLVVFTSYPLYCHTPLR